MAYRRDERLIMPNVNIDCDCGGRHHEGPNRLHRGLVAGAINTPFAPNVIPCRTPGLHLKSEENRPDDQSVGDTDIPSNGRPEKSKGDDCEDDQCDAFLQNLELRDGPLSWS